MKWPTSRFTIKAARAVVILTVVLASAGGSLAAVTGGPAVATAAGERGPGAPVVLRADPRPSSHRTPAPARALATPRVQTAEIIVNYLPAGSTDSESAPCYSWPGPAMTAFDYAASVWETLVTSSVPIVIDACWAELDEDYLGYGGPAGYYRDFTGAPMPNTWYPVALTNALLGWDRNGGDPEIITTYSRAFDWYFGTDGNTPPTQYDFVSVVAHEIAHGLGFAGSMLWEAGWGQWGGGTEFPVSYDRFTQDGAGNALIDTVVYPNPSLALGSALTSNNVWFDGPNANAANDDQRVKLYAPSTWLPGSSYSHLDDEVFNDTPNALMTHSLSPGESNHSPGPVAIGILADIGWVTSDPTPAPTVTSISPNSGENTGAVSVSIAGSGFQTGASVKLTRAGYGDIDGTEVTVVSPSEITCSFDLFGRAAGSWNVVVINPDTQSGTLSGGFDIIAPVSARTWTGSVSNNWHAAGNWTPSGVPTASDDVTIPDVANDPIISSADAQANNLTIHEGAVLDLTDRTLTVEGTLTNNGTLKQTQAVAEGSTTDFLRITNLAGTQTKYWGVDVTPTDVGSPAGVSEPTVGSGVDIRSKLQVDGQSGSSAWSDGRVLEWAPPATSEAEGPMRQAGDQVLYSVADACVVEGYSAVNFGHTMDMWAGYDDMLNPNGKIVRSLVRFNIADLSSGQDIKEATLRLYLVGSWDYPNHRRTIGTYRATSAWSESSVTWNNRPGFAEAYDSTSILHEAIDVWYEFDVTDLVRAWYDGTYTNHGIMIRGPEISGADSSWRAFGTRESDFAPQLVVTYETPPANSPPHQPHAPSPAHGATDQSVDVDLAWSGGDPDVGDTVTYSIYFGTSSPPPFRASVGPFPASQTSLTYDPGPLAQGTQYFWRVVATDNHGASTTGPTWTFTTGTTDARVTVSVAGNQRCAGRETGVMRCFDVSPEADMAATVRFYFSEAERSGLALQDLLVFRYVGQWTAEPGPYTRGGAGNAQYVEAENVGDFSLFALDTTVTAPPPTVTSITPNSGDNTGSVSVSIAGSDFQGGASVKLTRAGYDDINATEVTVVSPSGILCNLNLVGKAAGSWNVVVINPDTRSGTLTNGFTITAPPLPGQPSTVFLPLVVRRYPPVPAAPNLHPITPNPSTDGNYTVSWSAASGPAATSYQIEENGSVIQSGYGGTSRSFSGKSSGTYTYRVRGWNAHGYGPWSNTRQVAVSRATTNLYVGNDTGDRLCYEVYGSGIGSRCFSPGTHFYGSFPSGTYNWHVSAWCASGSGTRHFESGPFIHRFWCE